MMMMDKDPLSVSRLSRVTGVLLERARPLLLVSASSGAEALARRGGLTCTELVRPFCDVRGFSVPFRTPNGIVNVREFTPRVLGVNEAGWVAPDAADAAAARAAAAAPAGGPGWPVSAQGVSEATLGSVEEATRFVARARGDPTPWFTAWRREAARALRAIPAESVDSPVCILVIVSTVDGDVEGGVREAAAAAARAIARAGLEPADGVAAVQRLVLLLHDAAAGPGGGLGFDCETSPLHGSIVGAPGPALARLRGAWGAGCVASANVNSATAGATATAGIAAGAVVSNPWVNAVLEPLAPGLSLGASGNAGARGSNMSAADTREVAVSLSLLLRETLMPSLEARLFALHAVVGRARSGRLGRVLGDIGSWLGGGSMTVIGDGPAAGRVKALAGAAASLSGTALAAGSGFLGVAVAVASGNSDSAPGSPVPGGGGARALRRRMS